MEEISREELTLDEMDPTVSLFIGYDNPAYRIRKMEAWIA